MNTPIQQHNKIARKFKPDRSFMLEIFKINTKSPCRGRFQTSPYMFPNGNYLLWQAVQLTPAGFGCGGSPALPTG